MDQGTQQNAAMVEETTAAAHSLAREAEQLFQLLGQFNVGAPAKHALGLARPSSLGSVSQILGLAKKGVSAFNGNAAIKADHWEEF